MEEAATTSRLGRAGRRPGRPEAGHNHREDILDAAEVIFSQWGFTGTTMRRIAEQAGVTQALVVYYFKSKRGLFEQVFLRRSVPISQAREARLKALQHSGEVTVRGLVEAFLEPTLAMRASTQGRAFLRLQARLHKEPPDISYRLRTEAYGGSTRRFVSALCEVVPGLSAVDANWRMMFMIGTYLYAFSDTHRMEEMLEPDTYRRDDGTALMDQISRFLVAGFEAA